MSTYLHGVETLNADIYGVAKESEAAVIGLIGTSPKGDVNKIKLITNEKNGIEIFGEDTAGYTIPSALTTIFKYKNPPKVLVINVYDPVTHTGGVADVDSADIIGEASPRTGLKKFQDAKS